VHEVAQVLMNTGDFAAVRPSLGAWTVYGLGTENQNHPALVALSSKGSVGGGDRPWGNAFLPPWCGGTGIPTTDMTLAKMIEHVRSGTTSLREQRRQLDLLSEMHEQYAAKHPEQAILDGRIQAFETAFRMQVEAGDAFDLSREPKHIRDLYGEKGQGRQLLLARRLVERGVRFVQVWHNGWDTHDMNDERHRELAAECDQPLHALLTDLKDRDMLKDTLVIWGGEFGRTPTADGNDVASKKGIGRDHHPSGFTIWMAGGGAPAGHRVWRHRRIRRRGDRKQRRRARPACHDPAHAGLRSRAADLPLCGPRFSAHRRSRSCGQGSARLSLRT
jgi:hypothetical protein